MTPAFDVPWLQPFPDARFDVGVRADMRLALVAAMQVLPPRQRAVLLLREVLEFSAAEVAAQLGTTVPAVNSALQRARAALADLGDVSEIAEPDDPEVRAVIGRYVRAFEAADVPALVRLLADDAVLEMPPVPLWYRGSRDYGLFMRRVFEMHGAGWGMQRLSANGQPALAAYAPDPGGGHWLHTLQVFTVTAAGSRATSCSLTQPCSRRSACPTGFLSGISATLTDTSAWANSRVIGADLTDAVKREQRDVVITGSLSIVHALMAEDLIDEYRLLTFPTILGTGERLFPASGPSVYLECLSAEQAGAVVLARYGRAAR